MERSSQPVLLCAYACEFAHLIVRPAFPAVICCLS